MREDFENRCAYSMVHQDLAGGAGGMNIDHFDPRRKQDALQRYDNLFWSSRECNGKKHKHWPTPNEEKLGIRFLDCTKEQDYGVHIFEDPETNELWGATPAGRYHVRILNLNADVFVRLRKIRAIAALALQGTMVQLNTRPSAGGFIGEVEPFRQLVQAILPLQALGISNIEFRQKPPPP